MSLLHSGSTTASDSKLYPEDVFSTYLYTGNGSTQTITNGIDLAGKGGLVWIKQRTGANSNYLTDTFMPTNGYLKSDNIASVSTGIAITKNIDGFSIDPTTWDGLNATLNTYASWTFRKAPKFFDVQTKVHTNGVASTVDLSSLGTVGMVVVKATSTTSNWYAWHRGLTAGSNLKLNLTDAQSTTNAYLSVSGTTLTISSSAPSATYVIYAFAHDPSADGIIQCGSYVGTGGTTTPNQVTLGWEPQYVLVKPSSGVGNWAIADTMRGSTRSSTGESLFSELQPNSSASEATGNWGPAPTATGFSVSSAGFPNASGVTYIYLAIRRPMKTPTSGTEVYNAIARTGTGAAATVTGVGFAPDMLLASRRTSVAQEVIYDRPRGKNIQLRTASNAADLVQTDAVMSYDMDGVSLGADVNNLVNPSGLTLINHFFKRAKGFFDIVCYTGTGVARTVAHNLGAVPELMIVKNRSRSNQNWVVWKPSMSNTGFLNRDGDFYGGVTYFNSTSPTQSVFSLGASVVETNWSGDTHIAYLFASLPGISKVGSYTGNGTSQTIPCGFSTGARFILIKRTDSTGDWKIIDSVRGITASSDPTLALNSTAAEVTGTDCIDPNSAGFDVVQEATNNLNVNGGQYVFLAIS